VGGRWHAVEGVLVGEECAVENCWRVALKDHLFKLTGLLLNMGTQAYGH
jgi:hypothetical protein